MENREIKYSGKINYIKAHEWGLNPNLCILFDWMYGVPAWAEHVIMGTDVYYFASKNKAISDLIILTDKPNTMYKYYKQLEEKDLIEIKKIDGKDYIRLTEKAKGWDKISRDGFKSEQLDKNPSEVGYKSESNSDKNPTYTSIIYNNTIRDIGKSTQKTFQEMKTDGDFDLPNAFEMLKTQSPMLYEQGFAMKFRSDLGTLTQEEQQRLIDSFNDRVIIEGLELEPKILLARLRSYTRSWLANLSKEKQNKKDKGRL